MSEKLSFKAAMEFAYGVPRELSPGVTRVVANNPSPYTYKGTNSYLIGTSSLALVDPGPDDPAHLDAILKAAAGRPITHIVLTHTHRDHYDGLAAAVRATKAETVGYGPYQLQSIVAERPGPGGEGSRTERNWMPDRRLRDGERLAGDGWALTAAMTPGHCANHAVFALDGTGVLFSGDHVMAWSTTIVAPPDGSMADYMASLDRLQERDDRLYLPGHGGPVKEPQAFLRGLRAHRKMRERAILERINGGDRFIPDIVAAIYRGTDPRLHGAAGLSVLAHLEDLVAKGLVRAEGDLGIDSEFRPG